MLGNHDRINYFLDNSLLLPLSQKGISIVVEIIAEKKLDSREDLLLLFKIFKSKGKIDWLSTKPDSDLTYYVLNVTSIDVKKLHDNINDDFYFAKLFLPFNKLNDSCFDKVLDSIGDLYIKNMLYSKFAFFVPTKEICLSQLDRYQKIKNDFLKLDTEEEKTEFIRKLKPNNNEIEECNDINMIKRALLQHIKDPYRRMSVISSMSSYIDDSIQQYVIKAKAIILDYLSSNGELTREMRERIEIVFNSFHVEECSLKEEIVKLGDTAGKKGVNGNSSYKFKKIRISSELTDLKKLTVLIHEFGHALSHYNDFINKPYDKIFNTLKGRENEEGIVEAFTQNAWYYYCKEHNNINLNNMVYNVDALYKKNVYSTFTSIAKTLLDAHSDNGNDVEILKDYLLSNKQRAYKDLQFDRIMNTQDNKMELSNEMFHVLLDVVDENSNNEQYLNNNKIILSLQNIKKAPLEYRERLLTILTNALSQQKLSGYDEINGVEAMNDIFEQRKLFQILPEEIDLVLNTSLNLANVSAPEFFKLKILELSDDECTENYHRIVENLIVYISADETKNNTWKTATQITREYFMDFFENGSNRNVDTVIDFQKEIELYMFLLNYSDVISRTSKEIPELGKIQEQAFEKIKQGIKIPTALEQISKRYTKKDFQECSQLLQLLIDSGAEIDDDAEENMICSAIENSRLGFDTIEKTASVFENSVEITDRGGIRGEE